MAGLLGDNETIQASRATQCVVDFAGLEINTASFAMYTFSLSVMAQALLIITMSGAADHGSYRKSLLVVFAFVGSISTMLFLAVPPQVYALAALLAVLANTCFGSSFVLLNSFLPLLVRHHPILAQQATEGSRIEQTDDTPEPSTEPSVNTPLLQSQQPPDGAIAASNLERNDLDQSISPLRLSTQISSNGMGISYIGSVLLQITCILVVKATNQTTFSLRLVMFLIGLWWFLFTIPSTIWLRPRPGPPLPVLESTKGHRSWFGYMAYSWKALGKTVMRARRLKDVGLFLAAWFLLSDGIATVS
jgi:UMF1 family MFS transporter